MQPSVLVCDVTARDGLQIEPTVLSPSVRAELASRLAQTGFKRVEAVSFVRDDLRPQMAHAEEVVAQLEPLMDVEYSGLVLNEVGYERLHATLLDRAVLTLAVTEEYNLENSGQTLETAYAGARRVLTRAQEDGVFVTVILSCAFGCPLRGRVSPQEVLSLVARLREAGADEVVLADTAAMASPSRVARLVAKTLETELLVGFHGHGPRALENSLAALDAGASVLDCALAGLGGSTVDPRGGNTPSEDLVYALERRGVSTGVDLDQAHATADWLLPKLGH